MEKLNRAATVALTAAAIPSSAWTQPKSALHVLTSAAYTPETISVNFKDVAGQVTALQLKPWQTIQDVKRTLAAKTVPKGFGLLVDHDQLVSEQRQQRLFYLGQAMQDARTVKDYHLKHGDTIHRAEECVATQSKPSPEIKVEVVLGTTKCPPELRLAVEETRQGLESGIKPQLAHSGLGGTYFLRNEKKKIVGVFKPEDEEAYAPNNPRGFPGHMGSVGVRGGLRSGEANVREVAAYLLDHDQFANVPATVRVEISHPSFGDAPKIGSFQKFAAHDEEAGDVSPSLFTVEAAHRIAIIDIRLLNTDRNDENLLVKKSGNALEHCELIPIDHGCSLPDSLEVNWYDWAWLSWPQSKQPLSSSEKAYIARLDAEKDAELLSHELAIRWQCLLVLRVATTFLQLGAAADLSLYDIASMMSRDDPEKLSVLEIVFAQAKTLAEFKQKENKENKKLSHHHSSPPLSPMSIGAKVSVGGKAKKKIRRSVSAQSLSLDAFKLPGVAQGVTSKPCDDGGAWALEDCSQDLFDEDFWNHLKDLMKQAFLRRQMKRRAVETFKSVARSESYSPPSPTMSSSLPFCSSSEFSD